jgi:hypothetical protein
MAKDLKTGDQVTWTTSQGETTGKVIKKQTTPTKIKSHKVAASADNPQFIVESEKSGKRAAHKPSELRKKKARRAWQGAPSKPGKALVT